MTTYENAGKHRYQIEAMDNRNGQLVTILMDGNTRTQAASFARKLGYDVHSVNMVG